MKRIVAIAASLVFIFTIAQVIIAHMPDKTDGKVKPYHSFKFFSDLPAEVYVNERLVGASPASVSLDDEDPVLIRFVEIARQTNRHTFRANFVDQDVVGFAVRLSLEEFQQASIDVETLPAGADIYLDGKKHPTQSPCKINVDTESFVVLTIQQKGYKTEHISVAPNGGPLKIQTQLIPD